VRAGRRRVVDLHGCVVRVAWLNCRQTFGRGVIAERIMRPNPWLTSAAEHRINPYGDAEVDNALHFQVPECSVYAETLKPDIAFFDEFVLPVRFEEARGIVAPSDALLVLASSRVVHSRIRLVGFVAKKRSPIVVVVDRGKTKADSRAAYKTDAGTTRNAGVIIFSCPTRV